MVQDEKKAAVYVAFRTFQTALEVLDQGLPPRIDTSVWPTLAGSVRGQLIPAFKFLGLIDAEKEVLPQLTRLIAAKEDERVPVLRRIMERSYPTIIEIGQTNASSRQLHEAMREYNVKGDTLDKAVRFYLKAAVYCGLPVSSLWKKRKRARRGGIRRKARPVPKEQLPLPSVPLAEPGMMAITLRSGGSVQLVVTVDVTKLSDDDRDFVFELIDKMHAYEEGPARAALDAEIEVEEEGA